MDPLEVIEILVWALGLFRRILGITAYTVRMQRIHKLAVEEAARLGTHLVGPEHYLLALLGQPDCAGAWILHSLGVSLDDVRQQVLQEITPGPQVEGQEAQLTPGGKRLLDRAFDEARQLFDGHLGTEHLLLALAHGKDELPGHVLASLGADWERVARRVLLLKDLREAARLPSHTRAKLEAEMGAGLPVLRRQALELWEAEKRAA